MEQIKFPSQKGKYFNVKAYVGFGLDLSLNHRQIKRFLNEMESLSEFYELKISDEYILKNISFKYIENIDTSDEKLTSLFRREAYIFLIEFNTEQTVFHGFYTLIRYHIEKRIQDLTIALSIAYKGLLHFLSGLIYFDGKLLLEAPMLIHDINFSFQRSKELKWPKIKLLKLRAVINWLNFFTEETDGLSKTKIGRALNAYSHLFMTKGGEDDQAALFWALLGIEALYANSKENIQHQVNTNSQLFLGERTDFKKSFRDLYEYRSRFVHGDLNFNNQFVLKNGTDEFTTGIKRFSENEHFAVAILLSSFQKLITKNMYDINFISKTIIKS